MVVCQHGTALVALGTDDLKTITDLVDSAAATRFGTGCNHVNLAGLINMLLLVFEMQAGPSVVGEACRS